MYKSAGKCDYQQNYKDIMKASMVSNLEGLTDNIKIDVKKK